jgi:hypothetical protein
MRFVRLYTSSKLIGAMAPLATSSCGTVLDGSDDDKALLQVCQIISKSIYSSIGII